MKEIKVKYGKAGKNFEILVNEKVFDILEGKNVNIEEVLIVEEIFRDVSKGERASEEDLKSVFNNLNKKEIALKMIKEGHVQIPTEYRKKKQEEKKKQIINFIAMNAIDPKTRLPIPPKRIELALEQIKYNIDPFKGTEVQAEEIVDKMLRIMPIKMEKIKLAIKMPVEHMSKVYSFVRKESKIIKEEYSDEGYWLAILEIPGGYKVEFIDKLSKLIKGDFDVKELN